MNEITKTPPMPFSDMMQLADAIAKSGLFGMKTKEQALVLMAIAHAEGRHPVLAARDWDIIQGKPAKKAEAMMRDFLEAGGRVEWHTLNDELADATFTHPQTGSVRVDWDIKRAAAANLAGKDNWKKFPRQMLRSRVVSEGVRTLWPLATSGLYVPEEVADIPAQPEHNGPTVEHDAREAINAEVPIRTAAADMPRGARVAERAPAYEAPPEPRTSVTRSDDQWRAWLLKLGDACKTLYRREEVVQVGERASVGDALANGPPWVQREVSAILAANYARFPEEAAADADPFGEVEIVGAEKAQA
jgi:hypothetical protein